ncbi:hypothetical protein LCGC14_1599210, partial [marine sediment metagenome]
NVVTEATETIGAEACGILLREGDAWSLRHVYGPRKDMIGSKHSDEEAPHIAIAAQTKQPVVIEDALNDKRVNREQMKKFGVRSLLTVPLITKGKVIGIIGLNYHMAPVAFTNAQIDFATKLASSVSLAYQNAMLYEEEHNIASTLQKSLLPISIPKIKGLEVKFLYRSATKGAEVGGDFFDIFETPNNNFGIVMADVSGKGVDAAAETAKIKYLLRDRAYTNLGPTELLSSINDTLFKQGADRFTALTYGVYDPQTSTFTFTNAGNPYPYEAGKDRFLKITGVPVSVQENAIYSSLKLKLKEDDVIIMFTDGLTEARCDGDFFGEQRVRDFVKKNKHLSLKQLLSGLIKEANNFAQKKLNDDILIVGIKKL